MSQTSANKGIPETVQAIPVWDGIDHRQAPGEAIDNRRHWQTPIIRTDMDTVILTTHLLVALALIIVVLLQRSEGGGLGIGGGGGGVMSGRGAATALSKLTWGLGIAFVATSLTLTVLAARDSSSGSVVDTVLPGTTAPADDAAPAPGLDGDLLPPAPAPQGDLAPPPADGPAAPPPVE